MVGLVPDGRRLIMAKRKIIPACDLSIGRVSLEELSSVSATVTAQLEQAKANIRFASAGKGGAAAAAKSAAPSPALGAPSTNRGGKSDSPDIAACLVMEDGEVKEIPARRTWGGDEAFLDWVNFTCDENDYLFGTSLLRDEEYIDRVSYRCKEIFGFGITQKRETGANFYRESYVLGENCGLVCHGGQRSTVLVMLSGEGCAAAKPGWEKRLYDFLTSCGPRAKLTRVDLAHDCYHGETEGPIQPGQRRNGYSVDQANKDFDNKLFNCGGRDPNCELRGNWKKPTGKGRTIYVGNRENGKFCRVYEKGRQLGDKSSPWVRIEVEMKAVSRILDFEILLYPGRYLAASYPAFAWINDLQERIVTTQKKLEITYQRSIEWAKQQVGALLYVMLEIEGSAEAAISKLVREGEFPKRLKLPSYLWAPESVHEFPKQQVVSRDVFDAMALA